MPVTVLFSPYCLVFIMMLILFTGSLYPALTLSRIEQHGRYRPSLGSYHREVLHPPGLSFDQLRSVQVLCRVPHEIQKQC